MKNAFDARGNFKEWIQNDWESDDYIENSRRNSAVRKSAAEPTEEKPTAWHYLLAVIITLVSSPLFWIAIVALAFWIDR